MKVRKNGNATSIEFVCQIQFGGRMPVALTNAYIGHQLSSMIALQERVQGQRRLDDWDEADGRDTAEFIMMLRKLEKGVTMAEMRVREATERHEGLRELEEKHAWVNILLTKVVANKLRPAGDSKAKLCNMSAKQAEVIGGALASCIAANLTAHAAVDEWILRYPAMGELDREYVRERSER
jgi:hypothetical protein